MRAAARIVQVASNLEVMGDLGIVRIWGVVMIVWIVGGRIGSKVIAVRCEARVS